MPVNTMVRKFRKETGLDTIERDWRQFATLNCRETGDLTGERWVVVHYFMAHRELDPGMAFPAMNGETPAVIPVATSPLLPLVPNVRWLIPMGLSEYRGERARSFTVTEVDPRTR